jgi:hypothetical protein
MGTRLSPGFQPSCFLNRQTHLSSGNIALGWRRLQCGNSTCVPPWFRARCQNSTCMIRGCPRRSCRRVSGAHINLARNHRSGFGVGVTPTSCYEHSVLPHARDPTYSLVGWQSNLWGCSHDSYRNAVRSDRRRYEHAGHGSRPQPGAFPTAPIGCLHEQANGGEPDHFLQSSDHGLQGTTEGQSADPGLIGPSETGQRVVAVGGLHRCHIPAGLRSSAHHICVPPWREGPETLYHLRTLSGKVHNYCEAI